MKKKIQVCVLLAVIYSLSGCNGQNQKAGNRVAENAPVARVGGNCEAGYCELIYFGMPQEMNDIDTSAGWYEKGQKLMVSGTVFQLDGKTPAQDVIVYYHHTDDNGYYSPGDGNPENRTRHGHIRGWVKTDANGQYTIYTIRPAPYPDTELPAHIHLIIKEPDIANEYWINDIVFDDDPLLSPHLRKYPLDNNEGRCGSGIVKVLLKDHLQTASYNIVLGLNIPGYPEKN